MHTFMIATTILAMILLPIAAYIQRNDIFPFVWFWTLLLFLPILLLSLLVLLIPERTECQKIWDSYQNKITVNQRDWYNENCKSEYSTLKK